MLFKRAKFLFRRHGEGSAARHSKAMTLPLALRTLNIQSSSSSTSKTTEVPAAATTVPFASLSVRKSDVRKAYLARILECHPDTQQQQQEKQEQEESAVDTENSVSAAVAGGGVEFHRICEAYTFLNNRVGYTTDGLLRVRPNTTTATTTAASSTESSSSSSSSSTVLTSLELAEEFRKISAALRTRRGDQYFDSHHHHVSSASIAFQHAALLAAEGAAALARVQEVKRSLPLFLCGTQSFETFFVSHHDAQTTLQQREDQSANAEMAKNDTRWMLDAISDFDASKRGIIGKALKLRKKHNALLSSKEGSSGLAINPKSSGLSPLVLLGSIVFCETPAAAATAAAAWDLPVEAKRELLRRAHDPPIRCAADLCCFLPYPNQQQQQQQHPERPKDGEESHESSFLFSSAATPSSSAAIVTDWAERVFEWEKVSARRLRVERQIAQVANELSAALGLTSTSAASRFAQAAKRAGELGDGGINGMKSRNNNNKRVMRLALYPNPALETATAEAALSTMLRHFDRCISSFSGNNSNYNSKNSVAYWMAQIETVLQACSGTLEDDADGNGGSSSSATLRRICGIPLRRGGEKGEKQEGAQEQEEEEEEEEDRLFTFDLSNHIASIRVEYSAKSNLVDATSTEAVTGASQAEEEEEEAQAQETATTQEEQGQEEVSAAAGAAALCAAAPHQHQQQEAFARQLLRIERSGTVCCAEDILYDLRVDLDKNTPRFVHAVALALEDAAFRVHRAHSLLHQIQKYRSMVEDDFGIRLFVRMYGFEAPDELRFWRLMAMKENAELVASAKASIAAGVNVYFQSGTKSEDGCSSGGASSGDDTESSGVFGGLGGGWVSEGVDGCDKATITSVDLSAEQQEEEEGGKTREAKDPSSCVNFKCWLSDVIALSSLSRRATDLLFQHNLTGTVARSPRLVPQFYVTFVNKLVECPPVVQLLRGDEIISNETRRSNEEQKSMKKKNRKRGETRILVSDKFGIDPVEGRLEIPWFMEPMALIDVLADGFAEGDEGRIVGNLEQ